MEWRGVMSAAAGVVGGRGYRDEDEEVDELKAFEEDDDEEEEEEVVLRPASFLRTHSVHPTGLTYTSFSTTFSSPAPVAAPLSSSSSSSTSSSSILSSSTLSSSSSSSSALPRVPRSASASASGVAASAGRRPAGTTVTTTGSGASAQRGGGTGGGGDRGGGAGGGSGAAPRPRSVSSSLADLKTTAPVLPSATIAAPPFGPRIAKEMSAAFATLFTPSVRSELEFCRYHFEERRGNAPQVELEDATQAVHTIHRELESCTDLVGDVLGEITQQVHNISCLIGMQLLKASANQSKHDAESRQREEEEAQVKVEFMVDIEEERRKIDSEFSNDVIRLEAMHRVMATSD